MSKNWKGGPFGIFQHSFCRNAPKKLKGDTLGKYFPEKNSRDAGKKLKGRYCMIRGKKEKPFWFSCLVQQVQYKILVELFWSLHVYQKKH